MIRQCIKQPATIHNWVTFCDLVDKKAWYPDLLIYFGKYHTKATTVYVSDWKVNCSMQKNE